MTEPPTRRLRLVLGLGVAAYLIIAVGTAARKSPWPDEGWLSNPAFNLLTNGRMGTPVLEPAGTGLFVLPGIERYTYWVMPLYLLVQAGWYELAGFGVFQMRLLSTAWGLIALIAWNVTLSRLLDPRKAVFAIVLLATDYTFALNASTGRMDMMSASLGALAFAAYLVVRERSLPAA